MPSFDKQDLRICFTRCSELLGILQAYPDLYPIQDGANQVLSTLFRVVVRTVPPDAELHKLQFDNQEILGETLRTCSSLLVEMSTVFSAYAPIDALCVHEKTMSVILNEVVCRYGFQEDLKRLALALLTPHIAMNPRKDIWAVMLNEVQSERDAIIRRLGIIREIIEIYSPASDFGQSVNSKPSTATMRNLENHFGQVEVNSHVPDEDHKLNGARRGSTDVPACPDTTFKTNAEKVFRETERNVRLRAALRTCAPEHGAYISLDKEADDALREAAICKIASPISFIPSGASIDAPEQALAASSSKSGSAIRPLIVVDTYDSEKGDDTCHNMHTEVLDDNGSLSMETSVSSDAVEDTRASSETSKHSNECTRNASVEGDLKGLVAPKLNGTDSMDMISDSRQKLPFLHDSILKVRVSASDSVGSSKEALISFCSQESADSEKSVFYAEPGLNSHGKTSSTNDSSDIPQTLSTFKNLDVIRHIDAIVSCHLQCISASNAENTASLILEATQLSKDLFKKQYTRRAPLILQHILETACRDCARAASYARCLGRIVELVSLHIRDETMKDKQGVTLSGSKLLSTYLRNMCQEFSTQPLSDPDIQLGFSQLLGQLYIHSHILNEAMIHDYSKMWLENGPSMFNIGRLYYLLRVAGKSMDATKSGPLMMDNHIVAIMRMIQDPATSHPVVSLLRQLINLRDSRWQDENTERSLELSSLIRSEVEMELMRRS